MTNPIPSEAEIEAARQEQQELERQSQAAKARLEELRKQREAAEKAATDKAALMAACEAAIDAGLFELVGGELIYKPAGKGLSSVEMFILTLFRKGRVTVDELAGTKVVLDDAIGNVQKSDSAPKLTDDESLLIEWFRSGRVVMTLIENKRYVLDRALSRQRAEARRRKGAARTAASTQEPPQPTVAAVPDPTPAPQPPQAVEPTTELPDPGRRWPQRPVPSGPPSQVAGGPAPTWSRDSSYGPPLDYPDQSLERDLFGGDSVGTPPASERPWDPRPRQDDEANRKPPGWFSRNILGDRR